MGTELDRVRQEIRQLPAALRILRFIRDGQEQSAPSELESSYGARSPEKIPVLRRMIGIHVDELKPLMASLAEGEFNKAMPFMSTNGLVDTKGRRDGERMNAFISVSEKGA